MLFANLHNHSTFSDGVWTPEELADLAVKQGHKAIVLTDHDTAQGTFFMKKAARQRGLYCLTGTEFEGEGYGTDFHIVGIDYNTEDKEIREILSYLSGKQRKRTEILFNWAIEGGNISGITWQEVLDENPYNDYICNNHVWRLLVKKGLWEEKDYFKFFEFFKWYPPREEEIKKVLKMPPMDIDIIIKAIVKAGGVPIWAHPRYEEMHLLDTLRELGLKGVEINHPDVDPRCYPILEEYAKKHNMYISGGSDHSGVLGGFIDTNPKFIIPDDVGGTTEENFMDLYLRRKG